MCIIGGGCYLRKRSQRQQAAAAGPGKPPVPRDQSNAADLQPAAVAAAKSPPESPCEDPLAATASGKVPLLVPQLALPQSAVPQLDMPQLGARKGSEDDLSDGDGLSEGEGLGDETRRGSFRFHDREELVFALGASETIKEKPPSGR